MNYREEDIEFAIKILSDRDKLDNNKVHSWMDIPEHIELLKELAAIRQKYSKVNFIKDPTKEFLLLKRSIQKKKHHRIIIYRFSAAAGILLILGSLFLLQHTGQDERPEITMQILPEPSTDIKLQLSNGSTIQLGEIDKIKEHISLAGIRIDSLNRLNYSEAMTDTTREQEQYNTLSIPRGKHYTLTLADGTKVWLNSETELRYPIKFLKKQREVYLTGEAYFEVTHSTVQPFIVKVDGMEVKVLGTSFNINTHDQNIIETTLEKGSVCVKVAATGEELLLHPNEMAEFHKQQQIINKKQVDVYTYTAWKTGKFVFENETIEKIMQRLSRWYGIKVYYENENAKKQIFTGILEYSSSIKDILYLIEATSTIKFEFKERMVIIK